ncbi:MAG: metal ABC transporter permease [Anaerolineae bacterium]|nr:metal ABC transporter permease [Anaerolineae bacterium]
MMTWLIEPFTFEFMQRGLAAGLLVGIGCAILGTFVVLRGMAFVGDALAHTVLPGVVIAFLLGINLFVGALVAGVLTAIGIGWFSKEGQVAEDTAIGVMFSGLFALGIALLSQVQSYRDLTHILFGNILGVSLLDLWITFGVTVLVLSAMWAFFKELVATSFDPGHATVIGLSPGLVRYGLLILLALVVVSGIQTVGVVMVAALLVTPAATASLLTRRLPQMMGLAALFSVLAALAGLYASYYANIASGAAIVLVLTGFFILIFLFAPRHGLIWRHKNRSNG